MSDMAMDGTLRIVNDTLLTGQLITSFCTWLTRTAVLKKIGGARCWFETAEDLDLQFRLAMQGKIYHAPNLAYLYRIHDQSITHTQGHLLRDFFESTARQFQLQRQQRGYDDLMAGIPPVPPGGQGRADSAGQHIAKLLTGEAWRLHRNGQKMKAIAKALQLIKIEPFDHTHWRQCLLLMLKQPPKPPKS